MKNDRIKDKILAAAKSEFMAKGYNDASMRTISQRAGLTTGSLYNRFSSKQQLFSELVANAADKLYSLYMDTHNRFFSLSAAQQKDRLHEFPEKSISVFLDIIYDNFDEFKLIICHSSGSDYENYIERFIDIETKSTYQFIAHMNENGWKVNSIDDELVHILASALFNGFFQIVWHGMKKEDAENYIQTLFDFFNAGWDKILGI